MIFEYPILLQKFRIFTLISFFKILYFFSPRFLTPSRVAPPRYDEDDHFVGQRRDHPAPSFRVLRDVYEGYFVAVWPVDGDSRPVWIARAKSDPNCNPEWPNICKWRVVKKCARCRQCLLNVMQKALVQFEFNMMEMYPSLISHRMLITDSIYPH
jgi:hypothetical protein